FHSQLAVSMHPKPNNESLALDNIPAYHQETITNIENEYDIMTTATKRTLSILNFILK
ncbi:9983_t:CDS:1, partial [Ambispora leptoticha]